MVIHFLSHTVPSTETSDIGVTATSTKVNRVDFSVKGDSLHHALPYCYILITNDGQGRG